MKLYIGEKLTEGQLNNIQTCNSLELYENGKCMFSLSHNDIYNSLCEYHEFLAELETFEDFREDTPKNFANYLFNKLMYNINKENYLGVIPF